MKDIPKEHQDLVLSRIKKARQDPAIMLDWDEASKTLICDQPITSSNEAEKNLMLKSSVAR